MVYDKNLTAVPAPAAAYGHFNASRAPERRRTDGSSDDGVVGEHRQPDFLSLACNVLCYRRPASCVECSCAVTCLFSREFFSCLLALTTHIE